MIVTNDPGVYMIRCTFNGALYVGSATDLRVRLQGHLNDLGRGHETCELLQDDWNRYGPGAFECKALHMEEKDIDWLERELTLALRSLEQHGGYNKRFGDKWDLAARFRDTERKLQRQNRKYMLLPGVTAWSRIDTRLLRTFCQGNARLSDEIECKCAKRKGIIDERDLGQYLDSFQIVDLRYLRSRRTVRTR